MMRSRTAISGRHGAALAVLLMLAVQGASAPSAAAADSLTIPTRHPRLWWTPARISAAQQWYAANPFTPKADDALDNALRYVLTGEASYARVAIDLLMSFTVPQKELDGVNSNTYRWNDWVPVVFDWTYNAMTPSERSTFINRYDGYVETIRHKSWGGPTKPSSNYFWGYWRNELNWAIASFHHSSNAQTFLDHALVTRWENSFVPWAANHGKGGVAGEGTQYGRYMLGYPVIPATSSGLLGRDLYDETGYFKEAVFYVIYGTTPDSTTPVPSLRGNSTNYETFPFSDDEIWRQGGSAESSYYGDFMTMAATKWKDVPVGQYARKWLNMVTPSRSRHVKAVDPGSTERALAGLPLDYYGPGATKHFYARTGWGADATAILLQLGRATHGGHRHLDAGSFQIRRGQKWLSRETVAYLDKIAGYGGTVVQSQHPIAHNTVVFNGLGMANAYLKGAPKVTRLESTADYAYAVVDLSDSYRAVNTPRPDRDDNPYASRVQREFVFVRPLETLVVLDRLEASADGVAKTFVTHFQHRPAIDGSNRVLGVNGSEALRLTTLVPSSPSYRIVDESSFPDAPAKSHYQYRLEVDRKGAKRGDLLHVLQARDARGADVSARMSEDAATYTVTLTHPTKGNATIVFNKGLVSTGGRFGYAASGTPSALTPFLDRVQGISVTDSGPLWEGVDAPDPTPPPVTPPDDDPTPPPADDPTPGDSVRLYPQAEDGTILSAFQLGQDGAASGDEFLTTPADIAELRSGQTEVQVPVIVPSGGAYYLWARILGPAEDQDAIYVGFNGTFDRLFPSRTGVYEWIRVETVHRSGNFVHQLTAGTQQITVGHAEPQVRVDVFLVTNDPAFVPTGAPSASPPSSPPPDDPNQSPSVHAGSDQSVTLASPATTTLQGAVSDDGLPSGILTAVWTVFSGPGPVTFSDSTSTTSSATFLVPGSYVLQLTVSDGAKAASDAVLISVNPASNTSPPVAHAGADVSVTAGERVTLNGTGSYDANGDTLTYVWTQDAGPAVSLENAATAQPSFIAPTVSDLTDLRFSLIVSDGPALSQDGVTITVLPQGSADPDPAPKPEPGAGGILQLHLSAITETSAEIRVTTEQPTTATVQYGYSPALGEQLEDQTLGLTHTLTLTGLTAGSLYHFMVTIWDADGVPTTMPTYAFMTTGSGDLVAPGPVSGLALESVDDVTARLIWKAAGDDGSEGAAVAYEGLMISENLEQGRWPTWHITTDDDPAGTRLSTTLTELTPSTRYWIRVRARDEAGNWGGWSSAIQFKTQSAMDRQPPVVTGIQFTVDDRPSAVISWQTDEPTTGRVMVYDTDPSQLDELYRSDSLAASHTGRLTSLEFLTRYYVQVRATDASGNQTTSLTRFFDTPAPDTTPPAAIRDLRPLTVTEEVVEMTWTSPGDDGHSGQAASYEIRYQQGGLTAETWAQAARLAASLTPAPASAGILQRFALTGLNPGKWVFGIRSIDDADNRSGHSNFVTVTVPEPVVVPDPPAPEPDPEPESDGAPTITSLKIKREGAHLVVIWTTDKPTMGKVEYWPPHQKEGEGLFVPSSRSPKTEHRVTLYRMGGSQIQIQLRVWAEDGAGNQTVSGLLSS